MTHCPLPRARGAASAKAAVATFAVLLLGAASCTPPPVAHLAPITFKADSSSEQQLGRGLVHRTFALKNGPLTVHVLDIDLDACWTVRAVKAGDQAVGRATTTALVKSLEHMGAIAGVNADFFAFTPPGVPVGMTVSDGVMYTGSTPQRPVFWLSRGNVPSIGFALTMIDIATSKKSALSVPWNALTHDTVHATSTILDRRWGDTLAAALTPFGAVISPLPSEKNHAVEQLLGKRVRVNVGAATKENISWLPSNGWLWVTQGPGAAAPTFTGNAKLTRRVLFSKQPWTTAPTAFDTIYRREAMLPREVVGGQPVLVRDSAVAGEIETTGAESFRGVNPRTVLGITGNGRRLLLVVIDGRQAGYSVGATLRETAEIMRSLGARDAINLDGGGSTAMAIRDEKIGPLRLVNKPSDATGERPVADVLAVVPSCGMKRPYR